MSSGPAAASVATGEDDEGIPFGLRLQELAQELGDRPAVTTLAPDGTARTLSFAELDARANQWGRALAEAGAATGSFVALAIPNSQDLVLAALGCWKIGAVPIPMRWDLPDWERARVLEVINAAVVVDDEQRAALAAAAAGQSSDPLPTVVSPNL